MDFRNQNTCWNYHTVKEEGNPVCNDLPDKEECVDEVNLLPDRHTLHNKTRLAGPHDQRCCWNRIKLDVEIEITDTSPTKINFQPCRLALTARSMSSTVVRSFHPPASLIARIRHTPAVPTNTTIKNFIKVSGPTLSDVLFSPFVLARCPACTVWIFSSPAF